MIEYKVLYTQKGNFLDKKIKDVYYISKKTFRKNIENKCDYLIVGRTKLKEATSNNRKHLLTNNSCYQINKYKGYSIKGYVPVGESEYVELCGIYIPIVIIIGFIIGILISLLSINLYASNKPIEPDFEKADKDENVELVQYVQLDKLIVNMPEGTAKYEVYTNSESNAISNIIVSYVKDDQSHNLINQDFEDSDKSEYEFDLDFTIIDSELIAGSYKGIELITYSDSTKETKEIEVLIRQSNSGSVGISYTFDVNVDLDSRSINTYYEASEDASHDAIVQIILLKDEEEYLLGQSGIINPGQKISYIELNEEMANRLSSGVYNGYMRIFFNSEIDDYDDSAIHADIEIEINVN